MCGWHDMEMARGYCWECNGGAELTETVIKGSKGIQLSENVHSFREPVGLEAIVWHKR